MPEGDKYPTREGYEVGRNTLEDLWRSSGSPFLRKKAELGFPDITGPPEGESGSISGARALYGNREIQGLFGSNLLLFEYLLIPGKLIQDYDMHLQN